MNEPATARQIKFLQASYAELARDGDPRVCRLDTGKPLSNSREDRMTWARLHLGVAGLRSFSDLTKSQASYLCDILSGKTTKLDSALSREWDRLDIREPGAYFKVLARSKRAFWEFRGVDLWKLNRWQKWKLLTLLRTRRGQHDLARV